HGHALPKPASRALRLAPRRQGSNGAAPLTAIEEAAEKFAPRPLRVTMLGVRGFPNVQGGAENHAHHLAESLVALGCDVEVIVRSPYVPRGARTVGGIRLARL